MARKIFKGFPKDIRALVVLHTVIFIGVMYSVSGQIFPVKGLPKAIQNPWLFYVTLLSPVFWLAIPAGNWSQIWEAGFDIKEKTGKRRYWRIAVYVVLGAIAGILPAYLFTSLWQAGLMPLATDLKLVSFASTLPVTLQHLQWGIVAMSEEILVLAYIAIMVNWLVTSFGFSKGNSILIAVPIARFLWSTLHIQWISGPLMTYIISTSLGIGWTGFGLIFYWFKKKPLYFAEMNIIAPTIAHFVYDDLAGMFFLAQPVLPGRSAAIASSISQMFLSPTVLIIIAASMLILGWLLTRD